MFADLDDTIRQLLMKYVPLDPTEVEISFATPDREWSGRLTRPAVNCFLYDVRENLKLRMGGFDERYDSTANGVVKQRGPIRIDATYQVSTWARVPEDEHRLLWRVLVALARHGTIPTEFLQGMLKEHPLPIIASVAKPDQMPANVADLWQALDNRIRPVLTYVVTVALQPDLVERIPLILRAPSLKLGAYDHSQLEHDLRIRGRVRDRQDPTRYVRGALVLLEETGARAMTDEQGLFTLPNAPRGRVTLVVRADGRGEARSSILVPSERYDLEI